MDDPITYEVKVWRGTTLVTSFLATPWGGQYWEAHPADGPILDEASGMRIWRISVKTEGTFGKSGVRSG